MEEIDSLLQPESDNPADGVNLADAARKAKDILSKNKNKVIATGLAAAAIGGGTAGIESSRTPGPEVRADVPIQQYGHKGYPKPELKISESRDPIVEEIIPVPSNNPFENAQQLLYLAANTDPRKDKVALLRAWPGVMEVSGVTFYHAPVGSRHFMPFNPGNNGEADKLVVPPDEDVFIINPVRLVTYTDETDWIVVTLASDTSTENSATDIKKVYWLSLDEAEQKQAKFLAHKGSSSTGGYAAVPEGDATVNSDGNLQFGTEPADQISKIEFVKKADVKKKEAELGLVPALPPSNH